AQRFGRKLSALDGHNFHSRTDPGLVCRTTVNNVIHGTVREDAQTNGSAQVYAVRDDFRVGLDLVWVLIVVDLPSAILDGFEWRAGCQGIKVRAKKSVPVVGRNPVQRRDHIIERECVQRGLAYGSGVESLAEIID